MADLLVVHVETKLGDLYVFPGMPREMLENLVKSDGWSMTGQFVLVNVSGAALTMPTRIISKVSWDGGNGRWENPNKA